VLFLSVMYSEGVRLGYNNVSSGWKGWPIYLEVCDY